MDNLLYRLWHSQPNTSQVLSAEHKKPVFDLLVFQWDPLKIHSDSLHFSLDQIGT